MQRRWGRQEIAWAEDEPYLRKRRRLRRERQRRTQSQKILHRGYRGKAAVNLRRQRRIVGGLGWVSIFVECDVTGANVAKKKSAAKVFSSELVLHTRVFDVQREKVIEPSGVEATRDIIVHPGSVVVLPVLPDGRIVLIRQYRHSVQQYLWELVAGRRDGDESFVAGARRELQEETGYTARSMRLLVDLFPSPGFLRENMAIFLATGLKKGTANPEPDEKITQTIVTLREALAWIRRGKIRDGKTVAGILYYAKYFAQKK
jgi:ADP-ribose pyrophosphatase